MKVVFVDIDGVVLPERAWAMPCNEGARKKLYAAPGHDYNAVRAALRDVRMDACVIGLLCRLWSVTGAKLVISSNWRHTVGAKFAFEKLVGEGIPLEAFHQVFAAPLTRIRDPEKGNDILAWLDNNRVLPRPPRPEWRPFEDQDNEYRAAAHAFRDSWQHHGIEYVVFDDDAYQLPNAIRVDPANGISMRDYRIACRALGGVDPELGLHALDPADEDRILAAFCDDRFAAADWLHGPGEPVTLLWQTKRDAALLVLAGYDPQKRAASDHEHFWRLLEEATRHLHRPPEAELSDDF